MKFNYSKLLGRMRECGYTQEQLAEEIGISVVTFNSKIKNRFYFNQFEISKMCSALGIHRCEIGDYFYAV